MGSGRIWLAMAVRKAGGFIQDLSLAILRPRDIMELDRQAYENPRNYSTEAAELTPEESVAIHGLAPGEALCVGCGQGREIIGLSRLGFRVTGIDHSPRRIDRARERAAREGIQAELYVRNAVDLPLDGRAFDAVFLLGLVYCLIPTRSARVDLLKKIHASLRPGGSVIFDVVHDETMRPRRGLRWMKLVAHLVGGNTGIEHGDSMVGLHFMHKVRDLKDVERESREAGFTALEQCGSVRRFFKLRK